MRLISEVEANLVAGAGFLVSDAFDNGGGGGGGGYAYTPGSGPDIVSRDFSFTAGTLTLENFRAGYEIDLGSGYSTWISGNMCYMMDSSTQQVSSIPTEGIQSINFSSHYSAGLAVVGLVWEAIQRELF